MLLSPRRNTTCADLLRLVAGWLVLIVAVQSLQWAGTLGAGPRHRHGDTPAGTWAAAHAHDHAHAHAMAERHHHAPGLPGVEVDAADRELDEALERAAFALAAAFALLAFAQAALPRAQQRHVLRAAEPAPWHSAWLPQPQRPPRPA